MRIVVTTVNDTEHAAALARRVVDERLAACVNIVPNVRSIYRWQGRVVDEAELLLVIKTAEDMVDALRARLAEIHPYEVPEIVVLSPESVSVPYLSWVRESVRPD